MKNKNEKILNDRKISQEDVDYLKISLRQTLNSLEEHGAAILPHLTDTDMNSGEQLRYYMYKCGIGDMKNIEQSIYSIDLKSIFTNR